MYETTQKIRPETDPGDLWNIYLMIKELKPRRVLEYGSGASTYTILRALAENDQGSLLSYERDEEYGIKVLRHIPEELKRKRLCSGPMVWTVSEVSNWNPWEADFVYIDDANQDIPHTLTLVQYGTKILIDGRRDQTQQIIDALQSKRSLKIQRRWVYDNTLLTLGDQTLN